MVSLLAEWLTFLEPQDTNLIPFKTVLKVMEFWLVKSGHEQDLKSGSKAEM